MRFLLAALVCLMATNVYANHFGMAGCGLGSLAIKEPGKIQIVASLLNLTGVQTSAITTGTSGCYEDNGDTAAFKYIDENKEALTVDVSKGQGDTLAGLLRLWGCDNEGNINQSLQSHYGEIFVNQQNTPVYDIGNNMKTIIRSSGQKSCKALI